MARYFTCRSIMYLFVVLFVHVGKESGKSKVADTWCHQRSLVNFPGNDIRELAPVSVLELIKGLRWSPCRPNSVHCIYFLEPVVLHLIMNSAHQ